MKRYILTYTICGAYLLSIICLFAHELQAQSQDSLATPYARVQDGDTTKIKEFVRGKTGWWNSFRVGFGDDDYFTTAWPDDSRLLPKRLRYNDLFFFREIIVSTGDAYATFAQHPAANSRGFGGFPCFDVYYGAGDFILHKSGGDIRARPLGIFARLDGVVRSLFFDTVGTFGYDLLATTEFGSVYRIDSTGKATKLANVNEDIKAADIAPLGPEFGPYAGQLIFVSRFFGKTRSVDSSGNVSEIDADHVFPGSEALYILPASPGHEQAEETGSFILHWRLPPHELYTVNSLKIHAYALLVITRRSLKEIWALERTNSGFEGKPLFNLPTQVDEITFLTPAHLPSGGTCRPLPPQ